MIYLELIGESNNSHFIINTDQVFNVIFGDSGTGKTLMYNLSNKAKCKTLKTNASNVIPYVPGISINYLEPNSIVIIESDNITMDDIKGILKLITKMCIFTSSVIAELCVLVLQPLAEKNFTY